MGHLQSVVKTPQCGAERITDSSKTTTRSGVSLEHQERLVLGLCIGGGVEVWLDDAFACIVVKERGEGFLRVV